MLHKICDEAKVCDTYFFIFLIQEENENHMEVVIGGECWRLKFKLSGNHTTAMWIALKDGIHLSNYSSHGLHLRCDG